MNEIQVGSTITNGFSALRLTEHVDKDRTWKCAGWRGINVALEEFGGNPGTLGFVPDYLLSSWRNLPFEWTPAAGGALEERYVWSSDWRWLQREVRTTVPGVHERVRVKCTGEEGVVTRVAPDGAGLWVETDCNMYRNWSADSFERVT
jgi:hypothetical protein